MEKIKRFAFIFMLAAAICLVTACGRNDSGKSTTAPSTSSSAAQTSQSASTETSSAGNTSSSAGTNGEGESGGVLKDIVDDVSGGMDDMEHDMTDGGSGSSSASESSTEKQ